MLMKQLVVSGQHMIDQWSDEEEYWTSKNADGEE
jgi:hypothetical protein